MLWRNVYGGECDNELQLQALHSYLVRNFEHFAKLRWAYGALQMKGERMREAKEESREEGGLQRTLTRFDAYRAFDVRTRSDDEAFCGNLTWARFPGPLTDFELIEKGTYDTPMMDAGQYVELSSDYKR